MSLLFPKLSHRISELNNPATSYYVSCFWIFCMKDEHDLQPPLVYLLKPRRLLVKPFKAFLLRWTEALNKVNIFVENFLVRCFWFVTAIYEHLDKSLRNGSRRTFSELYYNTAHEAACKLAVLVSFLWFLHLMKRLLQQKDAHYFNSTASSTSLNPHIMLGFCSIPLSALAYWHFFERSKTLSNMKRVSFFLC